MTDEFQGNIWWRPAGGPLGGLRSATPGECAQEIQRLRGAAPCHTDMMISPEGIDDALETIARAKVVARILTDHGHQVTPPDEASLDDVEMERWDVCIEIANTLKGTAP